MFAFASCRVWDWSGETATFVSFYLKYNYRLLLFFSRGCYMRLSVVDCAHRWQVSFLPHPPSRGRVAAQRNCRLMSQLHLCSCSVVDVLSSQSSPHSHFTDKPLLCAPSMETKRRVYSRSVPVMTSNRVIWGSLQFQYSVCLSVFWSSCKKKKNRCCCLSFNEAKL